MALTMVALLLAPCQFSTLDYFKFKKCFFFTLFDQKVSSIIPYHRQAILDIRLRLLKTN